MNAHSEEANGETKAMTSATKKQFGEQPTHILKEA
jgi:hypothetical protein